MFLTEQTTNLSETHTHTLTLVNGGREGKRKKESMHACQHENESESASNQFLLLNYLLDEHTIPGLGGSGTRAIWGEWMHVDYVTRWQPAR